MISISTLYCGRALPSHQLRYGSKEARPAPVVVFNCTSRCNLACAHCYSSENADERSRSRVAAFPGRHLQDAAAWKSRRAIPPLESANEHSDELTTAEAFALLDDLAAMKSPAVLFSGGEPLLRPDLPELLARARAAGLRTVISTNGTLIDATAAAMLAGAGVGYVGISVDGLAETHDRFRGRSGAFAQSMAGVENCRRAGLKVGLRMTLTSGNVDQVGGVFDLLAEKGVDRICFYHLVYTGRGRQLRDSDLSHARRRAALDEIMTATARLHAAGRPVEVLTVDNHADGPYVYLRLRREGAARAKETLKMLQANRGNGSGERIGCVRPNGDVLPDQFWRRHVLGNVRERLFSEIWADDSIPLLRQLRRHPRPLTGRCLRCRWLDVCNGNFRARAEAVGGAWGDDPACYLTDEEIKG